jgi:hypothetical protein
VEAGRPRPDSKICLTFPRGEVTPPPWSGLPFSGGRVTWHAALPTGGSITQRPIGVAAATVVLRLKSISTARFAARCA